MITTILTTFNTESWTWRHLGKSRLALQLGMTAASDHKYFELSCFR